MDDPNYRGTWKNTSYSFDWSQYAKMLTTFDWSTKNMCPLIDVTALPDTADPCKSNGYRAPGVTPPDQTEGDKKNMPNWKQWVYREKLGFDVVYAQLEAKLDLQGRIAISPTQFQHKLFAGAIVEVCRNQLFAVLKTTLLFCRSSFSAFRFTLSAAT